MTFLLISFDIWKQFCKNYIKGYILTHDIYKWIPSDVEWDISGRVEKVRCENELYYVSTLEQDMFQEDFLSTLYNGNSRASYVSGCGFFYDTYHDDIIAELEMELFSRLCDINEIENDEDERDELCDYIVELEKEWIYDIMAEFTKEMVIKILKRKYISKSELRV